MLMSKSAYISRRIEKLDEMFPAQDILEQTGQIVKFESGLWGFSTIPSKVMRNVSNIIREELDSIGCIEVSLPILQPSNIWKASGRWEKYVKSDAMFTISNKIGEYCLAPTGEEAMTTFINQYSKSYRTLPFTYYQIGQKYRNELRTRGYMIRCKSFEMMDAYTFAKSNEEVVESYNKIREAYFRIFARLGFEVIPIAANNAEFGGKKSEEFMILSKYGDDKILVNLEKKIGFNTEILERADASEYLSQEFGIDDINSLKQVRGVEIGHIFQLGTSYSKNMNIMYTDSAGQKQPYHMGCFGIGISRIVAMIYEMNTLVYNNKTVGFSLPEEIAPYKYYIVAFNKDSEKFTQAFKLYECLRKKGISAILDDRDERIGVKMNDCKAMGIPNAIIIGTKTPSGVAELENIRTGEKKLVAFDEFI